MAHDKANLICENMCMVEGVTKEEYDSKVGDCKLKSDFAVLTGSMTVEPSSSEVVDIDYPTGFNKDNCVVISTMTTTGAAYMNDIYIYPYGAMVGSENGLRVNLGINKVQISIDSNASKNMTFNYKVVLMKVS